MQIAAERGPLADYESDIAAALPDWVRRNAQEINLTCTLQPNARQRYFIENPVGIIDEYHVFENVREHKAQFGERCILTALRE